MTMTANCGNRLPALTTAPKYVNMTDINEHAPARLPVTGANGGEGASNAAALEGAAPGDDHLIQFLELLYFAYRDFTSDPDLILEEIGFGRAHHRVLHFVNRYPGLRVADLLQILKITKQSLARVLKQLVGHGYIAQRAGEADRRERLLYPTEKGLALARQLAGPQMLRMRQALEAAGCGGREAIIRFLSQMISDSERQHAANVIALGLRGLKPVDYSKHD